MRIKIYINRLFDRNEKGCKAATVTFFNKKTGTPLATKSGRWLGKDPCIFVAETEEDVQDIDYKGEGTSFCEFDFIVMGEFYEKP